MSAEHIPWEELLHLENTEIMQQKQQPDIFSRIFRMTAYASGHNIKQQVTDWLGGKEKKETSERYNYLFQQFNMKLIQIIDLAGLERIPSEKVISTYYNMMFFLFYLKYDFSGSEEDFLEQYEENTKDLLELSKVLVSVYPKLLKPKEVKP